MPTIAAFTPEYFSPYFSCLVPLVPLMSRSHQKSYLISGTFTPIFRAGWESVLSWGWKMPQCWLAGRIANHARTTVKMLCGDAIVFPRYKNTTLRALCLFLKAVMASIKKWWGGVGASGDLRRGCDPGNATEGSSVVFTRPGNCAQPAKYKETQDYKRRIQWPTMTTTTKVKSTTCTGVLICTIMVSDVLLFAQ